MHKYSTDPLTGPAACSKIVRNMKNEILKSVTASNQAVLKAIQAASNAQVTKAGAADGSLSLLQYVINDLYVANAALTQAASKLRDWN